MRLKLFVPDLLGEKFNIVVAKSKSSIEYEIVCPRCSKHLHLVCNAPYPRFHCSTCKQSGCIIEMLQLFHSVSRRNIISSINTFIHSKLPKKKSGPATPQFPQFVFPINEKNLGR